MKGDWYQELFDKEKIKKWVCKKLQLEYRKEYRTNWYQNILEEDK